MHLQDGLDYQKNITLKINDQDNIYTYTSIQEGLQLCAPNSACTCIVQWLLGTLLLAQEHQANTLGFETMRNSTYVQIPLGMWSQEFKG